MKTTNASNPAGKNLKVIERKKLWFFLPVVVLLVAAIMVTVFAFTANAPVDMGVDFAGGYYITVKSSLITKDTYGDYIEKIENVACGLSDDDGKNYGLKIADGRRFGEDINATVYLTYKRIKGFSDEEMTEVGEKLELAVKDALTLVTPTVSISGGVATITYDRTMSTFTTNIENQITAAFAGATLTWTNPAPNIGEQSDSLTPYATELRFTNAATLNASEAAIIEAATIRDEFSMNVSEADIVSGTITPDLIHYVIAAIVVALVVIFAYFSIRFRSMSVGFSSALGVLIDLVMAICCALIFHIEITGLIMGMLAIVLMFSSYNKAVMFDRIKENMRYHKYDITPAELVNSSSNQILRRTITLLAFVSIFFVAFSIVSAFIGLWQVAFFTIMLIFGLISASYTTLMFAPSLWATINKSLTKPKEKNKTKKKEPVTI